MKGCTLLMSHDGLSRIDTGREAAGKKPNATAGAEMRPKVRLLTESLDSKQNRTLSALFATPLKEGQPLVDLTHPFTRYIDDDTIEKLEAALRMPSGAEGRKEKLEALKGELADAAQQWIDSYNV